DRHPVHRHRILVDFEEDRRGSAGRLVAGDDVVAQRGDSLPLVAHAEVAEESLEVVGDSNLVELLPGDGPAHRVDRRDADEVLQQAVRIAHCPGPSRATEDGKFWGAKRTPPLTRGGGSRNLLLFWP